MMSIYLMLITRLATGVACVPVSLVSELLVSVYRQFWPHGSSGQLGLVPGHRESPCHHQMSV